jgi:hypothetical protein
MYCSDVHILCYLAHCVQLSHWVHTLCHIGLTLRVYLTCHIHLTHEEVSHTEHIFHSVHPTHHVHITHVTPHMRMPVLLHVYLTCVYLPAMYTSPHRPCKCHTLCSTCSWSLILLTGTSTPWCLCEHLPLPCAGASLAPARRH